MRERRIEAASGTGTFSWRSRATVGGYMVSDDRMRSCLGRLVVSGALLALVLPFASGCASTRVVAQANDLADAGIAYGAAASQSLADARDQYLGWNARALLDELPVEGTCTQQDLDDEAGARAECLAAIKSFDDSASRNRRFVASTATIQAHAQALGAYFEGLKKLASYDGSSGLDASLQSLSKQIDGLSQALGGKEVLNEKQKSANSALAKMLLNAAKGRRISRVLERDVEVIATAIDIQERSIALNIATLQAITAADELGQELVDVRRPYLMGRVVDANGWVAKRVATLQSVPVIARLSALQTASTRLRLVWEDIVLDRVGDENAKALFDDLALAFDNLAAVRAAYEKK